MDTLQMEFGKMVRKYRKEKGYSTQKLAELLGVSVGLVNNIENGKSDVFKLEVLSCLLKLNEIPEEEFISIIYNKTFSYQFKDNNQKIEIYLPSNISSAENNEFKDYLSAILNSLLNVFEEYKQNKNLIESITDSIRFQLELYLKCKNYL
ncbi:helix-turn-helix domain-containing protein [Thermobrachium celere]|uniref:Putative transcriptional regulator n=1 Tax=Thermobrachium celere DSM 8682 TaxID=941824 RepID=R7RSQ2_9CLOT|nr:helix-turn-helix transcriptional regulator [Thermobrachium celere]CDF58285.1 putative transcriptional regulator [Thermobrachium celere DSM 8682]